MLEGTYVVSAQTPVGSKRGEVTFSHGVNGALRSVLNVKGLNIALSSARAEGDFFELSGTISHVLMGKAPLHARGRSRVIDSLLPRGRVPFRSR